MGERHGGLLGEAERLYKRHQSSRPRPFNVFAVLRSASDEVNLHSRFLHALLDLVDPLSGKRENLEKFVREVAQAADFGVAGARVQRESNHIDLLISNGQEAIVIENKIWAGDQEEQLQRYRDALVRQGYDAASIRMMYLTPFGHEPSEQSVGEIPAEEIRPVSYREDLRDWLVGCQRRAYDDPGLRESIAQYRRLIRAMTNDDYETGHMDELKALLLQDDHVVLAREIARSLVDAEAVLVGAFYRTVDRVLREVIEDLPEIDPDYADRLEEPEISRCVSGSGNNRDSGLYYRFSESAWLHVGGLDRLWCGVYCDSQYDADLHGELVEVLAGVGGPHHSDSSAPWWRWLDELPAWGSADESLNIRDPNEATLRFLSSGADSLEFARNLAQAIAEPWRTIKKHGLSSPR